MTDELAGYWPSAWPGEDGGPTRRQAPSASNAPGDAAGTFGLREGRALQATTRSTFAPTMCVLRGPGEVFLLCTTLGRGCVSWVERIHPESLEVLGRSPD
ncbi:MAG TPA: hypothetical protein VMT43_07500, partial [Acidimicrobiales bacterium]|nr:hypothetical protein [Acidimicrobiales bacterium]